MCVRMRYPKRYIMSSSNYDQYMVLTCVRNVHLLQLEQVLNDKLLKLIQCSAILLFMKVLDSLLILEVKQRSPALDIKCGLELCELERDAIVLVDRVTARCFESLGCSNLFLMLLPRLARNVGDECVAGSDESWLK